jgi:hypothetical protein
MPPSHPALARRGSEVRPAGRWRRTALAEQDVEDMPVGNYLLLYRQVTDGIEVVRVLYGARHVKNLL